MASSSTDMSLSWSQGCGMISWGWPFSMLTGQGNEWLVAGSADLPVMVMQFFSHKHIGRSPSFHSWTLAQPWKLETIDGSGGKKHATCMGTFFMYRFTYYVIQFNSFKLKWRHLWKIVKEQIRSLWHSADIGRCEDAQDITRPPGSCE